MLSYVGPGSGYAHAASPVAFLLLLVLVALVWSAVLYLLARTLWRRFAGDGRP